MIPFTTSEVLSPRIPDIGPEASFFHYRQHTLLINFVHHFVNGGHLKTSNESKIHNYDTILLKLCINISRIIVSTEFIDQSHLLYMLFQNCGH